MKIRNLFPYFVIAVIAAVLFIPYLGAVHLFDWDEINFAECAREMLLSKNYSTVQIGFLPFWEKPPLFIWMQAASMNFFGVNEFAARLPNAICGIITLLTVYFIGKKIYDEKFARIWALAFAGSILPAFYFHSGIIDPWFNLFIFLGIYQFIIYTNEFPSLSTQKLFHSRIIYSAIFISLAVLTKGPVALLIFVLCFLVWRFMKRRPIMSWKHFFLFSFIATLIPGTWLLTLIVHGKGNLVVEFLLYQVRLFGTEDAGHGGSFFYHWIILLFGCFPASVFAIRALVRKANDTPFELHFLKWMRILFWVVLILFSIVKTKIIHYSSLCWFPLTFLAAYTIYKLLSGAFEWKKWMTILFIFLGIFFAAVFTLLPFIDKFKTQLIDSGWIKDPFAVANLEVNAHWNGWEWTTGIILLALIAFFLFMIFKKDFRGIYFLFSGMIVIITLSAILFVPRVEEYSQQTAIDYWISHDCSDFYLETLGFKSYAHYFYGEVQDHISNNHLYIAFRKKYAKTYYNSSLSKSENEIRLQREWMLHGTIDYPAYFICKNTFKDDVKKSYPFLRYTGEKNGFVFWERVP
ncbi:MAG: glycosyltransferase family 39 protein [Bacteroidetes bacterium]|nr:glycosyltransferase family 39 protein [Bacteroidota bacterium]